MLFEDIKKTFEDRKNRKSAKFDIDSLVVLILQRAMHSLEMRYQCGMTEEPLDIFQRSIAAVGKKAAQRHLSFALDLKDSSGNQRHGVSTRTRRTVQQFRRSFGESAL